MYKPHSVAEATYLPHVLPDFHGHPLVEAMNAYPYNPEDEYDIEPLDRQLRVTPMFNERELEYPAPLRKVLPSRLYRIFLPGPDHRKVFDTAYGLMLEGMRNRNPLQAAGESFLYSDGSGENCGAANEFGRIATLIGPSGLGKSTAVGQVLSSMGHQLIKHRDYHGQPFHETQLLYHYFKVSENLEPADIYLHAGKMAGQLTGNTFLKQMPGARRSLSDKRDYCRMVLRSSHCGILVIDNLEYLFRARDDVKEEALSMILHIRDDFGIPILLVGTSEAYSYLVSDDSVASRFIEGGYLEITRPPSAEDAYWDDMVRALWQWKWVRKDSPLTDTIRSKIYEYTAGVTRYLMVLLVQAQILAIESGYEKLDEVSLAKAYNLFMKPIHPIVNGLLTNEPQIMRRYESMYADTTKLLNGYMEPAIGSSTAEQIKQVGVQLQKLREGAKPAGSVAE
ncbi:MAG: TniB family NTP-binding protein [Panacagrimonas sp.]